MNIKKELVLRGLFGFLGGTFIGTFITILISLIMANRWGWVYSPVVPQFADAVGNHLGAFILQFVLCGVLGAGFAMASVIYQIEHWSYLKQTIVHLLISMAVMFPIAYITRWMTHTFWGILSYILIFVGAYAVIWLILSFFQRRNVRAVNKKLKEK